MNQEIRRQAAAMGFAVADLEPLFNHAYENGRRIVSRDVKTL